MTPPDEPAEAAYAQVADRARDRRAKSTTDPRQERLAAALRENLHRRKAQARARSAAMPTVAPEPEPRQS